MKQNFKPIKTIHLALLSGLCLAFWFLGDLTSFEVFKIPSIDSTNFINILFPIAALVIGQLIFNYKLKAIQPESNIEEKLMRYQEASIIRWALIEGASFFILFAAPKFIGIGVIMIAYFVYLYPSDSRIHRALKIYH
ncbi:MAG: hypothetical protein BM564_03435 [Bacteroidetes bacterium MedPE-SWsnd-G2]|nr:MAG: hypothetical protein BM564_03435 [Bacteroidetes bacterium MedPE-SWsnd-G2]